jgi:UDP-N-acetylmuramoyl-tripeptide--D-alanyl-D-alanine ligase
LLGRHQVTNALLSVAVAAELGLSPEEVERGLAVCKPAKMRLQLWDWEGVQVLDDSYNANADSMRAALETLCELPCTGRRVAVLGEMAELGRQAAPAHAEIGRHAACRGVDYLFTVGSSGSVIADAARQAGLQGVEEHNDVHGTAEALRRFLKRGDLVLLKGSRATAMERVGELLKTPGAKPKNNVGF